MAERSPDPTRLEAHRPELTWRVRLAFVAGAEDRSWQAVGRGLTDEELQRVIGRYAGDVAQE